MTSQKSLHWHEGHRGLVRITGPDRISFVQRMCSQDVRPLAQAHQGCWALFLNAKGRLIDEVQILSDDTSLWLVTAPHKAQALVTWLSPYTIMEDLTYEVVGESVATCTVVHAPQHALTVAKVLQALGIPTVPQGQDVVPSAQGLIRAVRARRAFGQGVTLIVPEDVQATLVKDAFEGALGAKLSGPQQLRWLLQTGVATEALGDLSLVPPFELRLGEDSIHWHKGCYIGQEIISRLEAYDKVARLMMGIAVEGGAQETLLAAKEWRVVEGEKAVGKILRLVPDAMGTGLVGLCTVKREAAAPKQVAVHTQEGRIFGAKLFDCPQWQRETPCDIARAP